MKKIVLLVLLFMLIGKSASAYDMERFRRMPSCVFAERLDSIDGLENNGWTVSGNPTVATSPYKSAVSFDGTGDYVTCLTSVDQYDFGATGDFSVLFWIKTTDDSHAVMGNKRIDSNTKGWSVRIGAGGTIALKVADGSNYTEVTSVVMNDGVWHFVAFTVDRDSNSYPYVDGVQGTAVANVESGDDITSTDNLVIGADANAGFATDSEMFNVMVFDRELSATEISQIYNDTVFDYPLNLILESDCSEINPQDLWASYDGTGTGLAKTNIIQGHEGYWAVSFNGTDEKVDYGDVGNIRTIEMWVNPDTTTEELVLVDTGKDIMLSTGTVTYTGLTETNTFVDGVDTNTMVADRWQHLICVFTQVDANNLELANDGTNYGDIDVSEFNVYSSALEQIATEEQYITTR